MSGSEERQFDRYLRGDLTPAEARELARKALDSPALFEELTLAAVGIHGTNLEPSAGRPANIARFPRRFRTISIAAAAAAALAVAAYLWKQAPSTGQPVHAPQQPVLTASLDPAAGEPTLLAPDLSSTPARATTVFRSADSDTRAPQPEGTVIVLDNLTATVSLGAIDGLEKGIQLEVSRGASKQPIGRIEIETVFRDRARATILSGTSIHPQDRVQASPPVYLAAVLDRVESLASRGDLAGARKTAREALNWSDRNSVSPGATRQILARLGSFDYQSGDITAAVADYRSVIENFNSPPAANPAERARVLNDLGVLLLMGGDATEAEAQFRQLTPSAAEALNNLGVSAEVSGDRQAAKALYARALSALDSSPIASPSDRRAIQTNLARVSGATHENR
ncbi:MAG TPA: hypothetical protein VKX49_28470 [Bryobacteraceae bacterium]|nr:hypothetical protein [Bryobacteraceae bacterium]